MKMTNRKYVIKQTRTKSAASMSYMCGMKTNWRIGWKKTFMLLLLLVLVDIGLGFVTGCLLFSGVYAYFMWCTEPYRHLDIKHICIWLIFPPLPSIIFTESVTIQKIYQFHYLSLIFLSGLALSVLSSHNMISICFLIVDICFNFPFFGWRQFIYCFGYLWAHLPRVFDSRKVTFPFTPFSCQQYDSKQLDAKLPNSVVAQSSIQMITIPLLTPRTFCRAKQRHVHVQKVCNECQAS